MYHGVGGRELASLDLELLYGALSSKEYKGT